MNKQTHGIKSPGQLADGMATRVCKTDGPMKSVSIKPTKNTPSITGSGGAGKARSGSRRGY